MRGPSIFAACIPLQRTFSTFGYIWTHAEPLYLITWRVCNHSLRQALEETLRSTFHFLNQVYLQKNFVLSHFVPLLLLLRALLSCNKNSFSMYFSTIFKIILTCHVKIGNTVNVVGTLSFTFHTSTHKTWSIEIDHWKGVIGTFFCQTEIHRRKQNSELLNVASTARG